MSLINKKTSFFEPNPTLYARVLITLGAFIVGLCVGNPTYNTIVGSGSGWRQDGSYWLFGSLAFVCLLDFVLAFLFPNSSKKSDAIIGVLPPIVSLLIVIGFASVFFRDTFSTQPVSYILPRMIGTVLFVLLDVFSLVYRALPLASTEFFTNNQTVKRKALYLSLQGLFVSGLGFFLYGLFTSFYPDTTSAVKVILYIFLVGGIASFVIPFYFFTSSKANEKTLSKTGLSLSLLIVLLSIVLLVAGVQTYQSQNGSNAAINYRIYYWLLFISVSSLIVSGLSAYYYYRYGKAIS